MNFNEINFRKNYAGKFFGGILSASLILFGAASCSSGSNENEEGVVQTEELGYDSELVEAENETVGNNAVGDFERWDANQDERFDETEFETVANDAGFYNEWDADGDGALAGDELNNGIYGVYDEDNDGAFSNEEFDSWNTAWGGEYDYNSWDANGDNSVDANEFNAGTEEAGVYNDWDADNDGIYGQDEVNMGLYNTWDRNEDGNLASEEYEGMGYNLWGF